MFILRNEVEKLIELYAPSLIIIEDVWFGNNIKTGKLLAKFSGIIEELCYRITKKKPIVIENTKVKGFFKCSTKEVLFEFIVDILAFDIDLIFKTDNDAVDSIAQAFYYISEYEEGNIRQEKDYGFLYTIEG